MAYRPEYHMIMGGSRKGSSIVHKGCGVHSALYNAAYDAISEPDGKGYFECDRLLTDVEFGNGTKVDMRRMADSIHWDYIIRKLNEEHGAQMYPLAENFFRKITEFDVVDGAGNVVRGPDGLVKRTKQAIRVRMEEAARRGDDAEALKLAAMAFPGNGKGKTTAGYGSFHSTQGALSLALLKRSGKRAKGVEKKHQLRVDAAVSKNLIEPTSTPHLYRITG